MRFPELVESDTTGCMGRAIRIREDIASVLDGLNPTETRVQIEGYAFASSDSAHASRLAELGGVVKSYLHGRGFTYTEVPPTSVKKFWSGSGRADKLDMFKAAAERKHDVEAMGQEMMLKKSHDHPVEDIVDAMAIVEFVKPQQKKRKNNEPPQKKRKTL